MIWLSINLILLPIMGVCGAKLIAISTYNALLVQINTNKSWGFVGWNFHLLKSKVKHVKIKCADFIGSLRLKNENQRKKTEKARKSDCKSVKKRSFNSLIDSF